MKKNEAARLSAAPEPGLHPAHTLLVTLNFELNLDAIVVGSEPWKL